MLKKIRTLLRDFLFQFIKKIFSTDEGKAIIRDIVKNNFPPTPLNIAEYTPTNYPELGLYNIRTTNKQQIVFISGRFRSGSTLLWNIFRHINSYTSYYEPFNERRWFNKNVRGSYMDKTHINVSNYWSEYDNLEILDSLYDENWIRTDLYMEKHSWNPQMLAFIQTLIAKTSTNIALQFNRIDFRLPWIQQNFPQAIILHIFRHPREQWCSTLIDIHKLPRQASFADFNKHDHFYLQMWCKDLRHHFPFLDIKYLQHPYQLFYLIWRLSYIWGIRYSNYSICYENLVYYRDTELNKIFALLNIPNVSLDKVKPLISQPKKDRWSLYASQEWFESHEMECEKILYRFFSQCQ